MKRFIELVSHDGPIVIIAIDSISHFEQVNNVSKITMKCGKIFIFNEEIHPRVDKILRDN